MSNIFIMAGTKGGIGKTLVATLLADAAADFGYRTVLFDCDNENHSFYNAMKTRSVNQILEEYLLEVSPQNDFPLDHVINRILEIEHQQDDYPGQNAYIIDTQAGSTAKMLNWMQDFPFEMLQKANFEVHIVGVITSDPDSSFTYAPWLRAFHSRCDQKLLRFITILNDVDGREMTTYHQTLEPILKQKFSNSPVITIRNLSRNYLTILREHDTSYGRVGHEKEIDLQQLGIMGILRCQTEFNAIKEQLLPILGTAKVAGDSK